MKNTLLLSVLALLLGRAGHGASLDETVREIFTTLRATADGAQKSCTDCHHAGSETGSRDFDDILDFSALRAKGILNGAPRSTRLYRALTRARRPMPLGASPLSAKELALVERWLAVTPTNDAADVKRILETSCLDCHGPVGKKSAGIDFIGDLARLVAEKLVVPGKPEESTLYQKITDADVSLRMPLGRGALSDADVATIKRWITAGATTAPDAAENPRWRFVNVFAKVHNDFWDIQWDEQRIRTWRWLVVVPQAGHPERAETMRNAVSQLLNGVSWKKEIVRPHFIDEEKTIMRIDLRDYGLDPKQWAALTEKYPYGSPEWNHAEGSVERYVHASTAVIRADWFLSKVSQPPFYHDFLKLPPSESGLESIMGIDMPKIYAGFNPEHKRLARAGFRRSGVSSFNRVIERVGVASGAYWRSYDFGTASADKSVLARPLGPAPKFGKVPGSAESFGFQHDGGEIIFSLPNGLQAYMLVNNADGRLDAGPAHIVYDRERGQPIVNGIACMSCHANGLIPKRDEVVDFAQSSSVFFETAKREIARVYATPRELAGFFSEDSRRYREALRAASYSPNDRGTEITKLVDAFEADVTIEQAAVELGYRSSSEAMTRLGQYDRDVTRVIAPLLEGKPVPRAALESVFPKLFDADLLYDLSTKGGRRRHRSGNIHEEFPSDGSPITYRFRIADKGQLTAASLSLGYSKDVWPRFYTVTLKAPDGNYIEFDTEGRRATQFEPIYKVKIPISIQGDWVATIPPTAAPAALTDFSFDYTFQ